jgi:hypothetical protein
MNASSVIGDESRDARAYIICGGAGIAKPITELASDLRMIGTAHGRRGIKVNIRCLYRHKPSDTNGRIQKVF